MKELYITVKQIEATELCRRSLLKQERSLEMMQINQFLLEKELGLIKKAREQQNAIPDYVRKQNAKIMVKLNGIIQELAKEA